MNQEIIANGGVQYVPQIVLQYVYLDFDGELTSYNGEILTINDVKVFHPDITEKRITNILTELNAKYAAQNVIFVTERPTVAEYSTIYIGKTEAFAPHGNFAGLAETLDKGNQIKTDNAFVMLDASSTDAQIISTISHETDHLLGTLDHGGEGLEAYAARYDISGGVISSGITLSNGSMYISNGGTAENTTINSSGYLAVFSGGTAERTTITGGHMSLINGTANNTVILDGHIDAAPGILNNTVLSGGAMFIWSGGAANNTVVHVGKDNIMAGMRIEFGGAASNTTINPDGYLSINGGIHRGSLQIARNAGVSAYGGAVIDFTVANHSVQGGYLINDLSRISGTPLYTITVANDQANGEYKLAQGAPAFTGTISIGDESRTYGSVTVNGQDLVFEDKTYSLDQTDGNLVLTITGPSVEGNANGISWSNISGTSFSVEYSKDDFKSTLSLQTSGTAVDTYQMPDGDYQYCVSGNGSTWHKGEDFTANAPGTPAQQIVSDADGNMDLFFANASGTWHLSYMAEHQGVKDEWTGTHEQVSLAGKNKITDVFAGSDDANILVMTDDANGDALFMDDIYSALGDQARLSQIEEIRAGAGDDIIDMTSFRFDYNGSEMTIHGGAGNDVIWATGEDNDLFGDAGDDRIIGSCGFDLIVGGAGNDSMHTGGGGNDIFAFCENWGVDTIQLTDDDKYITLWFADGNISNFDAENRIYQDGSNSVQITGGADCIIALKFGNEGGQYEDMLSIGAFESHTSEKIFEDKNKGLLA